MFWLGVHECNYVKTDRKCTQRKREERKKSFLSEILCTTTNCPIRNGRVIGISIVCACVCAPVVNNSINTVTLSASERTNEVSEINRLINIRTLSIGAQVVGCYEIEHIFIVLNLLLIFEINRMESIL